MKKWLSFLRSYVGHVGAYFMFTILAFVLFSKAIGLPSDTFNTPLVWTSLLFAALVGAADYVFRLAFLGSYYVKLVVHGILVTVSFALSFVVASDLVERGRTAMFGILSFFVFYLVIAAVRCVYHSVTAKKSNERESYTNLYTPKNLDK
jgi:hypothetical protein